MVQVESGKFQNIMNIPAQFEPPVRKWRAGLPETESHFSDCAEIYLDKPIKGFQYYPIPKTLLEAITRLDTLIYLKARESTPPDIRCFH
jgi:hypothetical protein